ncbi:unnamed protein product [Nesidiocoris tenuis]|uniref:Uncharacterized protein n=1 Tax=Nesidiocoris tenuis TaxID=355587 RepID=A0A6H5G6I7_9HEMI|nr:unnamed protein product [Nesidiocoris tenuis]CAA9998452.1 unnamed protein product [Nesidiocoris tenuis]
MVIVSTAGMASRVRQVKRQQQLNKTNRVTFALNASRSFAPQPSSPSLIKASWSLETILMTPIPLMLHQSSRSLAIQAASLTLAQASQSLVMISKIKTPISLTLSSAARSFAQ